MEETPVIIVGAGPSGLALALSLSNHKVASIILEKEVGITEDPRGVVLAGDSNRILYHLGLTREDMDFIGHDNESVNFHRSSFGKPPFWTVNTSADTARQVVSGAILQSQPKLGQKISYLSGNYQGLIISIEAVLRNKVKQSPYCDLREGCEVISRQESDEAIVVEYVLQNEVKNIKASFMVGADGKKGVVRKKFLEQEAGIVQRPGLMQYEGCWIAANLKLHLPTKESHPKFPLWALGYSPEDVYDLFWPKGWHFCCPPGKPTAAGRFGPHDDRFWRHEFAEPDWNDEMDALELFWQHITPMITRDRDDKRRFGQPVTFPLNAIEIIRCRPFTFSQKVVNKWHHKRTILIGDAAHVFPPFGGQGIASGVRDAHGLAWRIAILLGSSDPRGSLRDQLLNTWAAERRQGIDDSTKLTMKNGKLCNEEPGWQTYILSLLSTFSNYLPFKMPTPLLANEWQGYKKTSAGCFLKTLNGGTKLPQVYLRSTHQGIVLSDEVFKQSASAMKLYIIGTTNATEVMEVKQMISNIDLNPSILNNTSLVCINGCTEKRGELAVTGIEKNEAYAIPAMTELETYSRCPGYDAAAYFRVFGPKAKYAIVRADFIIFGTANDLTSLNVCLEKLRQQCCDQAQQQEYCN